MLKSLYEQNSIDETHIAPVKIRSFVASAANHGYNVATAEIDPLPVALSALVKNPDGVRLRLDSLYPGSHGELRFDTEFVGLTTLHSSDSPIIE